MNRLTMKKPGNRYGLVDGCCLDTIDGIRRVIDRLAAYEDTGLAPEEVTELKKAKHWREVEPITHFEGIPIQRLQELAWAEKNAVCREYEAYYDGAYDAIKAVRNALAASGIPELAGGTK